MSNTQYDLVILHHNSEQSVEKLVQAILKLLNRQDDPYLEYKLSESLLFNHSKSAVLEKLSKAEGEQYQKLFRQLQIETELRPTLQLVDKSDSPSDPKANLHTCPACGHTQPKAKGEGRRDNECV